MEKLDGADETRGSPVDVRDQQVMTVIGQERANRRRMDFMIEEMSGFDHSGLGAGRHHLDGDVRPVSHGANVIEPRMSGDVGIELPRANALELNRAAVRECKT
jgi:hypothetical protein